MDDRIKQSSPSYEHELADITAVADLFVVSADAPKVNYRKLGFFEKFFELQRVMWQTNAGLTDRHMYDSRPSSWPQLRRGIVRASRLARTWRLLDEIFTEFLGKRSSPNLSPRKPPDLVFEYGCNSRLRCRSGPPHSSCSARLQRF